MQTEETNITGTGCPACKEGRVHTAEEWKNHPLRGQGYTDQQGWTEPDLHPTKKEKSE